MTSLTFALDPVDAAVRALLDGVDNLNVHYGTVTDSDSSAQTISAPLPYVLLVTGTPFAPTARVGGRGDWLAQFRLEYVGATEDSCKAVLTAVRDFLDGAEITVGGKARHIRLYTAEQAQNITADTTWTRPDGGPLIFVWDTWNVL